MSHKDFEDRLKRIDKTVRKKGRAKGYQRTGVMDFNEQERRKYRANKGITFRGVVSMLFILWLMMLGVREFMASQMGEAAYQDRIVELSEGGTGEQLAATLMTRGSLIKSVREYIDPYLENIQPSASGSNAEPVADVEIESNEAPDQSDQAPEEQATNEDNSGTSQN